MSPAAGCQSAAEPSPALGLNTYADSRFGRLGLSFVIVSYIRASHSHVGEYCSHLPIQSTYPLVSSLGNCKTSGRIQASHVKLPVVGIENAVLDGTVRYPLAPSKPAPVSPFGIDAAVGGAP